VSHGGSLDVRGHRHAEGEKLQVIWPDAFAGFGVNIGAPVEIPLGAISLMAHLMPERLEDLILAFIEAQANGVMAPARPKRIAELEKEITSLRYVEETLVVAALDRGESEERSNSAPPECVLGIRVGMPENKESRAA
jgi:hypothetical protein